MFLLADDLGWGDVNYNGGLADTPHLNAMASGQHSVQFSRFYSGAPVCSPTRGTILTGRNHNRYCIWRANTHSKDCNWTSDFDCPAKMPLPPSEVTVAEVLQNVGYHTGAFGKWHLGDLKHINTGHPQWSPSHPGMHGFDVWKVTERAVPTVNPNCACFDPDTCRIGHYTKSIPPACSNYYSNNINSSCTDTLTSSGDTNVLPNHRPPCPIHAHTDAILGDDSNFIINELKSFISDSVADSQPFFSYVAFHTPHSRYIATTDYSEKYTAMGLRQKESDYYGAIEALDAAIGEILLHLQHLGVSENTMIWFTSDNGPADNSPGSTNGLEGRKGTLYEGGIRVPGILQWPSVIEENRLSDYPVSTNDFLPTVLDITGTELPDSREIDGISILPYLLKSRNERSAAMNWAFKINADFFGRFHAVSLYGDLKLHAFYKDGLVLRSKLYNITQDEVTDIASAFSHEHTTMLRDLNSWIRTLEISSTEEVGCLSNTANTTPT